MLEVNGYSFHRIHHNDAVKILSENVSGRAQRRNSSIHLENFQVLEKISKIFRGKGQKLGENCQKSGNKGLKFLRVERRRPPLPLHTPEKLIR